MAILHNSCILHVVACLRMVLLVHSSETVCDGFNEEYSACLDLLPCTACTPVDCKFTKWSDWYSGERCTGICYRSRNISQPQNECGLPCRGTTIESKVCTDSVCGVSDLDCEFSQWQTWSACVASTDQSVRTRIIAKIADPAGKPCIGRLKETKDCGAPAQRKNCILEPWADWTTCSATCNGGHKTRKRDIHTHALGGGNACIGNLSITEPCSTVACAGIQNCIMGTWTVWSLCSQSDPNQRYRNRPIASPAKGGGKPCFSGSSFAGVVKETMPCPISVAPPVDCQMSVWSDWKVCSETCGKGQTFRHRALKFPSRRGGVCNTTTTDETKVCMLKACVAVNAGLPATNSSDCNIGVWTQWSTCSMTCGQGVRTRNRRVLAQATGQGTGCIGGVKEVQSCLGLSVECHPVDCQWGAWEFWSGCSKTCGGGFKRRNRFVAVAPVRGGQLCQTLDSAEIEPCSNQPCLVCRDGVWADWGLWSTCSTTCGNGTTNRHREIGLPPSICGKPPTGNKDEYKVCVIKPCVANVDCAFSEWGAWSACCPDCYGVRKRTRQIAQYAVGYGRSCEGAVWETRPCNPGPDGLVPDQCLFASRPSNCNLSPWSMWSKCTITCGGGQRTRERSITTWPDFGGESCMNTPLAETRKCGTGPCSASGCIDCLWSQWSDWGHCFKCGDQRERKRQIERLPNHCGRRCDARSAAETTICYSHCHKRLFCAWTEWTSYTTCPRHGCGPHLTRRHRVLHWHETADSMEINHTNFLFNGLADGFCMGHESDNQECPFRSCEEACVPKPCKFGQWTEWGACQREGLKERQRLVARNAICGARPCEGSLIQTTRCHSRYYEPVDCQLSQWTQWSQCELRHGQKYRTRKIDQHTMNGGKICRGPLQDTMPCSWSGQRNECELGTWSVWSTCTKTCGDDYQYRRRHILSEATMGGEGCYGDLRELKLCELPKCSAQPGGIVDCVLNSWTAWKCIDGQESRTREIQSPSVNTGKACDGIMEENRACKPVDCKISDWSTWSKCDRSCAGGTRSRSRQIDKHPRYGGEHCGLSVNLHEIGGCNRNPCDPTEDCTVSAWKPWGSCSVSCGQGRHTRERTVRHPRKPSGVGCNLPVSQTGPCIVPGCTPIDCVWADWSEWDSCSKSCGGGEHSRHRVIGVTPKNGGVVCEPVPKEMVQPCNMQRCGANHHCIDGTWGPWSNWGPCSNSCEGGLTWRTRAVSREANECGRAAPGPDKEYRGCQGGSSCGAVDCKFSSWEAWSGCTNPCYGIKRRNRGIEKQSLGGGRPCSGALKQTAGCNPAAGETIPDGCANPSTAFITCIYSDWSTHACSLSCGTGHRVRTRHMQLRRTSVRPNTSTCNDAVSEVEPCNTEPCPNEVVTPCHWGDWSNWSNCTKCGGERKRTRNIAQMPANGAICAPEAAEEVGKCPRQCHGYAPGSYCAWQDWSSWGSCDATCGRGQRKRRRQLVLKENGQLPDSIAMLMGMARLYDDSPSVRVVGHSSPQEEQDAAKNIQRTLTRAKLKEMETTRLTELAVAFVGGCMFFAIALFVMRRCTTHYYNNAMDDFPAE